MVGIAANPFNVFVPPEAVTDIVPEPHEGTMAVMVVGETKVKDVASTPANLTILVPLKLLPVIVTVVPAAALVGVKEEIIGGGRKLKPLKMPCPVGVTTLTLPEAPAPIVALIDVEDTTVKDVAGIPPKITDVAPVKFTPVMETILPVPAKVGVKELMVTGGKKLWYLVAVSLRVPLETIS